METNEVVKSARERMEEASPETLYRELSGLNVGSEREQLIRVVLKDRDFSDEAIEAGINAAIAEQEVPPDIYKG